MNSNIEYQQFDVKHEENHLSITQIKTEPQIIKSEMKTESEECGEHIDIKHEILPNVDLVPTKSEIIKTELKTESQECVEDIEKHEIQPVPQLVRIINTKSEVGEPQQTLEKFSEGYVEKFENEREDTDEGINLLHIATEPENCESSVDDERSGMQVDDNTAENVKKYNVSVNSACESNNSCKEIVARCFKCNMCSKSYHFQSKCTCSNEKPFICENCNVKLNHRGPKNTRNKSLAENTIHSKGKLFTCDICKKSFTYKYLLRHLRMHRNPFKCNFCEKSFCDKSYLEIHIRIHTEEKPFKCDLCTKSFYRKSCLVEHTYTHGSEKPFKCDLCKISFSTKIILVTHIRSHTKEKPFKCNFCEKSFTQKYHAVRHQRRHTNDKPLKCPLCSYSSYDKSALARHSFVHKSEKPFKCSECISSFSCKINLEKHLSKGKHIKAKPYKCNFCCKSYSGKRSFDNHVSSHKNPEKFKCDICKKSFSIKYNLIPHIKRHDRETVKI